MGETHARTILGCCCNVLRVRSAAFGLPTNLAGKKLIRDFPKYKLKWHFPECDCNGHTDDTNNRRIETT